MLATVRIAPLPLHDMIAAESTARMQTLLTSTSPDSVSGIDGMELFKRADVDLSIPLQFMDNKAMAQDAKQELAIMLSASDDASETSTPKPARTLTRRQLKHREAMVRFRQRKKAKIAVLEEEELKLQQQLNEALRKYERREARRAFSVDDLLGLTNSQVVMQRRFVGAVQQIEDVLDENEALEEAIAEHEKFHATLKRVRERTIETSVWKCV